MQCNCTDWVLTSSITYNDKWGEGSNKILFIGSEEDCQEFAEDMSDDEAVRISQEHASFHPARTPKDQSFIMYPVTDFKELVARPN